MGRDLFGIKFGAHLAAHLTPEWPSQYLQYKAIVAILYAAVDRSPSDSEVIRHRIDDLLLVLLQNYQALNHMSFKNVLTKHDKLIDEVEILVTEQLENGNRKTAMQKWRMPPLTQIHKGIVTCRLDKMNIIRKI